MIQIQEFPNYFITSEGEVYSRNTDRFLKKYYTNDGYEFVRLGQNGIFKTQRINRLGAKAFIPNPLNKPQVNHIDGIRDNNHFLNLEWCTQSENAIHSFRVLGRKSPMLGKIGNLKGRFGINHPRFGKLMPKYFEHKRSKNIEQYDLNGNFIKLWGNSREIQKELNLDRANIIKCCKGLYKQCYGFIWKYSEIQKSDKNKKKNKSIGKFKNGKN
jgi:hypothetical protein